MQITLLSLLQHISSSGRFLVSMARRTVEVFIMVVVMSLALLLIPVSARITFPVEGCADGLARCPLLAEAGECSSSPTYMSSVCPLSCKLCSPMTATTTTTTTPSQLNLASPSSQQSTSTTSQTIETTIVPRRSIANPDFECGRPISSAQSRRTRRQDTFQEQQRADPPFLVSASEVAADGVVQPAHLANCGASVIHERYLLTSAHCVLQQPVSSVRLGDINLAQENENNSLPADYNISGIFLHEAFNDNTLYHDIALLKTDRKIEFNSVVFPYCVSGSPPPIGTEVVVAGFGLINETHKSPHLMEATLSVLPMATCEEGYLRREEQRLKQAYPSLLVGRDGLLCVGDDISGLCMGDEGGPLFRSDARGRRFLEGIISFTGSFCGEGLLPGLSTSLADYVDFIDRTIYGEEQT